LYNVGHNLDSTRSKCRSL